MDDGLAAVCIDIQHIASQLRTATRQHHMVVLVLAQRDAVEGSGTGAVVESQLSGGCHAYVNAVAKAHNLAIAERFGEQPHLY